MCMGIHLQAVYFIIWSIEPIVQHDKFSYVNSTNGDLHELLSQEGKS